MRLRIDSILFILSLLYAQQTFSQSDTLDTEYKKFYYDNGSLSSEGSMIDGFPDGLWKTYFKSAQLKTLGERKQNKLEGEWFFYRENGNLERTITYVNNVKSGLEEVYNSEGILTAGYLYEQGKKNGSAVFYYSDGSVSKELIFLDGKENGKGVEYGTDGRIITFVSYNNGYLRSQEKVNRFSSKGEKIAKWLEYWTGSSKLKEEGNYSNGKRNGLFKIYNRKGQLARIETYKNGILQEESADQILDVQKKIDKDGKIKSIGSFSNGKKQGIFREYGKQGKILSSIVYENDVKVGEGIINGIGKYQGSWKMYYSTGELKAEGEYLEGYKNGKWRYYFLTGELEQEGSYKKNMVSGAWTWYFKNGAVKREEYYRKGREEGKSIEYSEEGVIINNGNYVDGLRTGDWFLTIGDHEEKGEYIDDDKNGKWKSFYLKTNSIYFEGEYSQGIALKKHTYYYPNGMKKSEGKHVGGERHGDWKFYNKDGTIRLVIRYTNGIETRLDGEKI